jgi:hypothetical protein
MKTFTFNFRSEQEEKVLLTFLDSLQYNYTPVENPGDSEKGGLAAEYLLKVEKARKMTKDSSSKLYK